VSEREDKKEESADDKIQDLDLDESEEGREITERVLGGRAPFSHES
jgi:hypothetical protein